MRTGTVLISHCLDFIEQRGVRTLSFQDVSLNSNLSLWLNSLFGVVENRNKFVKIANVMRIRNYFAVERNAYDQMVIIDEINSHITLPFRAWVL